MSRDLARTEKKICVFTDATKVAMKRLRGYDINIFDVKRQKQVRRYYVLKSVAKLSETFKKRQMIFIVQQLM